MSLKQPNQREMQALRFIRNALVQGGYAPSVREVAGELGYKSPRTAHIVIESLIAQGYLQRKPDGKLQLRKDLVEAEDHARTVDVPLVGNVPCGTPLLAEENIEAFVAVSTSLARV